MATAALDPAAIRQLATSFNAMDYWKDEASVNGIWSGLLADAFPGSEGFVLQPEGQGEGGYMRNDILVRKITDFTTGSQDAYLVFEGKSSVSADSLDKASQQLLAFVKASPKLSRVRKVWGIVAKGTSFRVFFYHDGVENVLQLPTAAVGIPGKPSKNNVWPDYSLAIAPNNRGSVESVQSFLAWAKVENNLRGFI